LVRDALAVSFWMKFYIYQEVKSSSSSSPSSPSYTGFESRNVLLARMLHVPALFLPTMPISRREQIHLALGQLGLTLRKHFFLSSSTSIYIIRVWLLQSTSSLQPSLLLFLCPRGCISRAPDALIPLLGGYSTKVLLRLAREKWVCRFQRLTFPRRRSTFEKPLRNECSTSRKIFILRGLFPPSDIGS